MVATVVAVAVVASALALWKLRVVIALLFLALTISAAMRPGVEWLQQRRVPRAFGVLIHYLAVLAVFGLLLWLIVPHAVSQVQQAIGSVPTSHQELANAAKNSSGLKHDFLVGLDRKLRHLPAGTALIHPAVSITQTALEVLVGIFFTFAVAAYWIFERERAQDLVLSLVAKRRRRVVRDTWTLIDQKLNAVEPAQVVAAPRPEAAP